MAEDVAVFVFISLFRIGLNLVLVEEEFAGLVGELEDVARQETVLSCKGNQSFPNEKVAPVVHHDGKLVIDVVRGKELQLVEGDANLVVDGEALAEVEHV